MIDFGFIKERDAKAEFDEISAELKRKFGLETLWRPHQIHSDTIFVDGEGEGDGIIITKPSIAVIRTADCVPVVLFDRVADIAGVFHSGWRGTELKIVSKGAEMMKELGCRNISAVIFPAIGFCCFEIGEELLERFRRAGIPTERRGGKLYADLATAIKNELETAGIIDVSDMSECTFCGKGYFSYRKDKTEKRHATFVALRKYESHREWLKTEQDPAGDIICVTCRSLCEGDFFERIEKIASCGVKAVILREKDLSADEYRNIAGKFVSICRKYKVEAVLHSFVDVAIELGVPALHLSLEAFRKLDKEKKAFFTKIGVSCHSAADAIEAERLGAAYVTFGHVFATDCKKGLEPRGIPALKSVCDAVEIPVFAIGGVNSENIGLVFENGAGGACIMSGFMKCSDTADFMKRLIREK